MKSKKKVEPGELEPLALNFSMVTIPAEHVLRAWTGYFAVREKLLERERDLFCESMALMQKGHWKVVE